MIISQIEAGGKEREQKIKGPHMIISELRRDERISFRAGSMRKMSDDGNGVLKTNLPDVTGVFNTFRGHHIVHLTSFEDTTSI